MCRGVCQNPKLRQDEDITYYIDNLRQVSIVSKSKQGNNQLAVKIRDKNGQSKLLGLPSFPSPPLPRKHPSLSNK